MEQLHLASCDACAETYCDSDGNFANGCEIDAKGNDHEHCGSCNTVCSESQNCNQGNCEKICQPEETYCSGQCLNLEELHLASCDSCAENYCDTDENKLNGCESYALADDAQNCGTCGNACKEDEVCENGTCAIPYEAHRLIAIGKTEVRSGPGADSEKIGDLEQWQYITAINEDNGWFLHEFNGQQGWTSEEKLLDACDKCPSRVAINYAEQFLYDPETKLCTYEHLTHEPIIENFTDLYANYKSYNHGYNDNCANFVSACLKSTGLMTISGTSYINVGQVRNHCDNHTDGYKRVDFEQAKAGDYWVNSSGGHTELVLGYKNGTVYLIGSNNFSSGGSDVCQIDTGASAGKYQRVSYGSSSKSNTGFICSRQSE